MQYNNTTDESLLNNANSVFTKKNSSLFSFKDYIFHIQKINQHLTMKDEIKNNIIQILSGVAMPIILSPLIIGMRTDVGFVLTSLSFFSGIFICRWLTAPLKQGTFNRVLKNQRDKLINQFMHSLKRKDVFKQFVYDIKQLETKSYIDPKDKNYLNQFALDISECLYNDNFEQFLELINNNLSQLENILKSVEKYELKEICLNKLLEENIEENHIINGEINSIKKPINYKDMV